MARSRLTFESGSIATDVPRGGTIAGFQVVLSRPVCCYIVQLFAAFVEPFATIATCFECHLSTAVRPSTWGRLKVQYR